MRPYQSLPAGHEQISAAHFTVGRNTSARASCFLVLLALAESCRGGGLAGPAGGSAAGRKQVRPRTKTGTGITKHREQDEVLSHRSTTPGSPGRTASESERRSVVTQYLRYLGYLTGRASGRRSANERLRHSTKRRICLLSGLSIQGSTGPPEEGHSMNAKPSNGLRSKQPTPVRPTKPTWRPTETFQVLATPWPRSASQPFPRAMPAAGRRRRNGSRWSGFATRLLLPRLPRRLPALNGNAPRLNRIWLDARGGRRDRRARRRRQTVRLTADPSRDYPDKCRSGYIVKRELFTTSGVTHPFRESRRSGPGQRCRIEVRFSGRKFALNYRQCWADGDCAWVDETPWSVGNSTHGAAHLGCGYGAYYGTMPSSESVYICWFKD